MFQTQRTSPRLIRRHSKDPDKYVGLGSVMFEDGLRIEARIAGIDRVGLWMQREENNWQWVYLCDVSDKDDVKRVCTAIAGDDCIMTIPE